MIDACRDADVRLMTAYRLHFEEGNLSAAEAIRAKKIGEPRLFNSTHTMQVADDNIRIDRELGGGPLEDIGVYCINASRYLFRSEPEEVVAFASWGHDPRFHDVPEAVCATMRFPDDRLATFQCGFGQSKLSEYRVIGTEGVLQMDPAYTWQGDIGQVISLDGKEKTRKFQHRDQIAAEILYFSGCVQSGGDPEPSGQEGLIDVRIIEALRISYLEKRCVKLEPLDKKQRPSSKQSIRRQPHGEPELVNAAPPSRQ